MITYRFRPGMLAVMALAVGIVLIVTTAIAVALLTMSDGENRRTISRFWALIPAMGVAGFVAVALGIRAAFTPVCADCGEMVEAQSEVVFGAEDSPSVIRMLSTSDWRALSTLEPLKLQKAFSPEMVPGTVVVQTRVCTGCGRAGTVRAYRAGTTVADASTVLEARDAPGAELRSLVATRAP